MPPAHRPVLLEEVLDFLDARRGGVFVDATFGGGGHTVGILDAHPENRVLALDRDAGALAAGRERLAAQASRIEFIHSDYRRLVTVLEDQDPRPDGLIADFGLSTTQLLDPDRGFSFNLEGPLDMRMDRTTGPTAAELVAGLPENELRRIIARNGEERFAGRIARAIVSARQQQPIRTTTELAEIVRDAIPAAARFRGGSRSGRPAIDPATRTFQALRIAVNDELNNLEQFVEDATDCVGAGGRVAFISFHSLEDRPVKQTLRRLSHCCICPPDLPLCGCGRPNRVRLLTNRAIRPSDAETQDNPAARSARLRAAERLAA